MAQTRELAETVLLSQVTHINFHKLLKLSITLKISKLVRFLVHILPVEKLFKSPNSKMVTHFFVISNICFFLPSLYL